MTASALYYDNDNGPSRCNFALVSSAQSLVSHIEKKMSEDEICSVVGLQCVLDEASGRFRQLGRTESLLQPSCRVVEPQFCDQREGRWSEPPMASLCEKSLRLWRDAILSQMTLAELCVTAPDHPVVERLVLTFPELVRSGQISRALRRLLDTPLCDVNCSTMNATTRD